MANASAFLKKKQKRNGVLYLSRGHFGGRQTWHYMLVDKMKLPILLKRAKDGEINLAEYGHILFSGFGDQPPEEVRRHVKATYH